MVYQARFGHCGATPGQLFPNRASLYDAGLHRQHEAGISGNKDGTDAIVLGGGHFDQDDGEVIVYTGEGGFPRDSTDRTEQKKDQKLKAGNAGLVASHEERLPVRVFRGPAAGTYGPTEGYRYDGLYLVQRYWADRESTGKLLWRFLLVAVDRNALSDEVRQPADLDPGAAKRRAKTVQALERNASIATKVKSLYDHRCQACNYRLDLPTRPYAEAAHVRGLGAPHDGPDVLGNLLCLCPTCHKLLDHGAFVVDDAFVIESKCAGAEHLDGKSLHVQKRHGLDGEYFEYHREFFKNSVAGG